jgi:hypothetical protein
VKIKVYLNSKSGSKKLADVSVLAEEGDDFSGLLFRGFNLWKGKGEGEVFVTPPNQRYQDKQGATKYYHHIKEEVEGSFEPIREAILEAYDAKISGADEAPPDDDGPF